MEEHVIPQEFLDRMNTIFPAKEEFETFKESLSGKRSYGLRRNSLKLSEADFLKILPFHLRPVPWTGEGYYYEPEEQPGKSIWHEAGVFYIQEPSAMSVVELLSPKPGEKVADLCAAPGGKTTHIAGKMQGRGLILTNEYMADRVEVLAKNTERMGVKNAVITQEDTVKLAKSFPGFFDRVLVDAPCSGEGMFRKEEKALTQWTIEYVKVCSDRQKQILQTGGDMVCEGGVLVYSTCTFSREENEEVIAWFLANNTDFVPDTEAVETFLDRTKGSGLREGDIPGTIRLFPHCLEGEGHFIARLKRKGEKTVTKQKAGKKQKEDVLFSQFCQEILAKDFIWNGTFLRKKDVLYLVPEGFSIPQDLRVLRSGLKIGEFKKGRFEPSHSFAMSLRKEEVVNRHELSNPMNYLRGNTEECGKKGWCLCTVNGLPVGWGKAGGNILKNHYPKGLRLP